jgi:hypothetical protein
MVIYPLIHDTSHQRRPVGLEAAAPGRVVHPSCSDVHVCGVALAGRRVGAPGVLGAQRLIG